MNERKILIEVKGKNAERVVVLRKAAFLVIMDSSSGASRQTEKGSTLRKSIETSARKP